MPATYEPIVTTSVTSNTASITFSSIPQTYTDLVMVIDGAVTSDNSYQLRFNNSTAQYWYTYMTLNESSNSGTAPIARASGDNCMALSDIVTSNLNTARFQMRLDIMGYKDETASNMVLMRTDSPNNGSGNYQTDLMVGLWESTNAITSITILANRYNASNQIAAGTIMTIYGIKAA